MGKNWQEYMFEDMPVVAGCHLLSKLQSDVRYAGRRGCCYTGPEY